MTVTVAADAYRFVWAGVVLYVSAGAIGFGALQWQRPRWRETGWWARHPLFTLLATDPPIPGRLGAAVYLTIGVLGTVAVISFGR